MKLFSQAWFAFVAFSSFFISSLGRDKPKTVQGLVKCYSDAQKGLQSLSCHGVGKKYQIIVWDMDDAVANKDEILQKEKAWLNFLLYCNIPVVAVSEKSVVENDVTFPIERPANLEFLPEVDHLRYAKGVYYLSNGISNQNPNCSLQNFLGKLKNNYEKIYVFTNKKNIKNWLFF